MKAHELTLDHFVRLYHEGGIYHFGEERFFACSPQLLVGIAQHHRELGGIEEARRALVRAGNEMGRRFPASLPEELDQSIEVRRAVASVARLAGIVESMLPKSVGDVQSDDMEMHWYGAVDNAASSPRGELGCPFTTGFITGFMTAVLGSPIYFYELSCTARGDERCIARGAPLEQWSPDLAPAVASLHGLSRPRRTQTLDEVERHHILRVVRTSETRKQAADTLGIGEATLYRRLRAYTDAGFFDG